ncbi:hypothetical protein ABTJ88_19740, partial [Acinetobacter baumannii]
ALVHYGKGDFPRDLQQGQPQIRRPKIAPEAIVPSREKSTVPPSYQAAVDNQKPKTNTGKTTVHKNEVGKFAGPKTQIIDPDD